MRFFKPAKTHIDVLILFCSAFLVRAVYIYFNRWLAGDSFDYLNLAQNLALHHTFGFGDTESITASAFRPPVYSAFISLFWWTGDASTVVLYLQALIGATTVVLIYFLAKNYFDRRTAITAAVLLSIEPFTVHYTACLMTETVFTFLIVLAVYLCDYKRYFSAGFAFGLAALTRATVLPFLLILMALSIFPRWSNYRKSFVTVFLVTVTLVSAWTIRNALTFKEFIPVSSTGYGYNLLCGTIDVPMLSDEGWENIKNDRAIKQRLQDLKNGKTETEADRDLFKEALRRIAEKPADWIKVRIKQYVRLYIDSAPYILGQNNMRFEDAMQNGNWFFITYKILLASRNFLAVGLALTAIFLLRERIVELKFVILFPIYLMLVHLPLWTENRYLLPMMPFVFILAAYTLIKIFDFVINALKL